MAQVGGSQEAGGEWAPHLGVVTPLPAACCAGFVVKRLDGPRCGRTSIFSAPSYFRTRAVCLGAVAGFEYTQSLLVFTSDEELHHFIDGEGFVGATLSVTAGSDMLR